MAPRSWQERMREIRLQVHLAEDGLALFALWEKFREDYALPDVPEGFGEGGTMRSLMSQRDSVKVVFDQVGTPTYALDLAKVIFKIIEENLLAKTGIYHFSNEGAISWYDFAEAIRDLSNIECDVQPCHTEEFPTKAERPRPRFSVLDKTKIKATFGIRIPYWRDSLKDCINRLDETNDQ